METELNISMRLDPSYFGFVLKGGVGSPVEWDGNAKVIQDKVRVCREAPMDQLLERIFKNELEDHKETENT